MELLQFHAIILLLDKSININNSKFIILLIQIDEE